MVATSVLPSPVASSASAPRWSTTPPASCTAAARVGTKRIHQLYHRNKICAGPECGFLCGRPAAAEKPRIPLLPGQRGRQCLLLRPPPAVDALSPSGREACGVDPFLAEPR